MRVVAPKGHAVELVEALRRAARLELLADHLHVAAEPLDLALKLAVLALLGARVILLEQRLFAEHLDGLEGILEGKLRIVRLDAALPVLE